MSGQWTRDAQHHRQHSNYKQSEADPSWVWESDTAWAYRPDAVQESWSTEFVLPYHAVVTMVTAGLFTLIADMYHVDDSEKVLFHAHIHINIYVIPRE